MNNELSKICVSADSPIMQVVASLNQGAMGIILVTSEDCRLLDTVVDGDVRRYLLAHKELRGPLQNLLDHKATWSPGGPVSAPENASSAELLTLMKNHRVRQIPLVNGSGRLVGIKTWGDLAVDEEESLSAVVMAGGFGTRLAPLTGQTPKPLLPVGEKPIMEEMLGHLVSTGIRRVNVATHYLDEQIRDYFGDGSHLGLELNYVKEDQPLGTAGALGLMDSPESTLLIINGDILTNVDFKSMMAFHREHKAVLTAGVRKYDLQVPFGVVETQGSLVTSLTEKPNLAFFINAGIYLLEPRAHGFIKRGEAMDMTDLIKRLLGASMRVASFPIMEYWLDIGSHEDYRRAQEDMRNGALKK